MTALPRFPRIEALLGSDLDSLQTSDLMRLVELGVSEDEQIDFKVEQLVRRGAGDPAAVRKARLDLAQDACALANQAGGVIFVGVDESDRVATALREVALTDGMENSIRAAIAENSAPYPETYYREIRSADDPSKGQWAIIVPPSTLGPHAFVDRERKGVLRYPIRRGAGTEWLTESEVASAYRSRFQGAAHDLDRLETVMLEGRADLAPESFPWLCWALVPARPRIGGLDRDFSERVHNWRANAPRELTGESSRLDHAPLTVGLRRMRAQRSSERLPHRLLVAHLHADGSAFFALELAGGSQLHQPLDDPPRPFPTELTSNAIQGSWAICSHASQTCGLSGEATVRMGVVDQLRFDGTVRPLFLGGRESGGMIEMPPPVIREFFADYTIDLPTATADPASWMSTSRMFLTDLLQAFGLAEPTTITIEGQLRPVAFGDGWPVSRWASEYDVELA